MCTVRLLGHSLFDFWLRSVVPDALSEWLMTFLYWLYFCEAPKKMFEEWQDSSCPPPLFWSLFHSVLITSSWPAFLSAWLLRKACLPSLTDCFINHLLTVVACAFKTLSHHFPSMSLIFPLFSLQMNHGLCYKLLKATVERKTLNSH